MRFRVSAVAVTLLAAGPARAVEMPYFCVLSEDAGGWPAVLSSIGLQGRPAALAHVFVARAGAAGGAEWQARVERGAILIVEGESVLADGFGFVRDAARDPVRVQSVKDVHRPE